MKTAIDASYLRAVESGDATSARRIIDAAALEAGYTLRVYHGTDERRNVFDGGAFFTDSRVDAAGYAEIRALHRAVDQDEALAEVVYDVLAEEGGEALTDMGPHQIREIAEANGFDTPNGGGVVIAGFLRVTRALDLTGFGSDVGCVSKLWRELHRRGLLDDNRWEELDSDVRAEIGDRYRGKAIYRFLEEEGVQARAFERGFDAVVFTDISPGGGKTHTTWLTRDAAQFKLADPVVLDDAGRPVPPSRRFDASCPDVRGCVGSGAPGPAFPDERTDRVPASVEAGGVAR